ncbi:MAG: hypothetical protein ACKOBV_02740, partial [Candidatus Kapaibacterium sp.]
MAQSSYTSFYSVSRERIFRAFVLSITVLFGARLGYLQFVRGSELLERSETQAIKRLTKEPYRGCMFDRHGKVMVQNSASYTLVITPNEFDDTCIPLLASITGMSREEISTIYQANKSNRFSQIKVMRDVDEDVRAAIEES